MQQTLQTNASFASSFSSSSTQQGMVPLNISIPTERMMKPPSCSHDHLLRPSPKLELTPCPLTYLGLNWWMTTEVPHTRKVRKGSSRLRMTELVYCVSLPARPYQRDTHGTEVEEQQHDDGGDVQPQYGGAVLAARDSSAPLLPHDQTVDEVLVQTLSFLSGKDVGDGQSDEGGENEAPRALHADHHRRRRFHALQEMLLCVREGEETHRRPSGRPGFPAR